MADVEMPDVDASAEAAPQPGPQNGDEANGHDGSEEQSEDGSSDDGENYLAVTRERRSNAGNRMSKLLELAEAEDEAYAEIFQEPANDEEFEAADDEADFSLSSSDEDEAGGDQDEEQGEKELKKQEQDGRRKRKRETLIQQMMKKKATRVAMPPPPAPSSPSTPDAPPRPKKKSERVSWAADADGAVRSSSRKLAVQSKEATHKRLKEMAKHRERTVAVMRAAERRKEANKPTAMTQADRLAEAARIERKNSKTVHRWEEAEKNRAEEQRERLAALKNQRLQGPVIGFYSGPALWVNDKLRRVGKEALVEDILILPERRRQNSIVEPPVAPAVAAAEAQPSQSMQSSESAAELQPSQLEQTSEPAAETQGSQPTQHSEPAPETQPSQLERPSEPSQPSPQHPDIVAYTAGESPAVQDAMAIDVAPAAPANQTAASQQPAETKVDFLQGIHYYASLSNESSSPTASVSTAPTQPLSKGAESHDGDTVIADAPQAQQDLHTPPQPAPDAAQPPPSDPAQPQAPPLPPSPLRKVVATRNLVSLRDFDLQPAARESSTSAKYARGAESKDPLTRALLAAPDFRSGKLAPPRKATCSVSDTPARYRDPVTGLPYADGYALKMIRRLADGGFVWSAMLGAYVGLVGQKPAKGVPEGFERPVEQKAEEPETTAITSAAGVDGQVEA